MKTNSVAQYTETLPNALSFDMIRIEGGTFEMGAFEHDKEAYANEKPAHRVWLDTFYMAKYPVTQSLWKAVIGEGNSPAHFKGEERPVENVSWLDVAEQFLPALNRLTENTRLSGMYYCLPTEAEWEYAARGGVFHSSYLYAGSNKLKEVGWYDANSYDETKPVGLKDPNELGLYDMSGNVWEWCQDWYNKNYYARCAKDRVERNPPGPETGVGRVLRGGSCLRGSPLCRVSCRINVEPGLRDINLGFRLALSPIR